jgi:DNA-binding response OmpR family regulator
VVGALDATSAIEALATWRPLVVVVDLQTGRAGGYALAKDLSQDARLASVPVIILVERDQDRWLAGQAGATEILRKPVDGRDLVRVISAVLASKIPA